MSPARLAAEAAFAAPTLAPASIPTAQVTVRKRRLAGWQSESLPDTAPNDAGRPVDTLTSTGPRTFRVEPLKAQAPDERPETAGADPAAVSTAEGRSPRARRPKQQRPGPVTHTVLELAVPPGEAGVQRLRAALAEVGPVLDGIQHAQSTTFIDPEADAAWQALSHEIDELNCLIQSQLLLPAPG
jgi:hypothetical protein